ncbi:hypothetical protein BY458DRAFT_12644 [Sporodiniella umbellata]|nr:hypothetical protein BY458DRAFT_12644 [Sporodiniella umbellata]
MYKLIGFLYPFHYLLSIYTFLQLSAFCFFLAVLKFFITLAFYRRSKIKYTVKDLNTTFDFIQIN